MFEDFHNGNQLIIGEAAVHLAMNNKDITVNSLIRELADMAAAEEDPLRCVQIGGRSAGFAGLNHYRATGTS